MMSNFSNIKIYHIVHFDKLPSIISQDALLCDAQVQQRQNIIGTNIGMSKIKKRRLEELTLASNPLLHVGDCVPFYFCPRSIMLYILSRQNHTEVEYSGGQKPIIHLVANMSKTIEWAESNNKHWAFTNSNAGSSYFNDYNDLTKLSKINWEAIKTTNWVNCKEDKQAEFLIEECCPWSLIEEIGVSSWEIYNEVEKTLSQVKTRPVLKIKPEWYY